MSQPDRRPQTAVAAFFRVVKKDLGAKATEQAAQPGASLRELAAEFDQPNFATFDLTRLDAVKESIIRAQRTAALAEGVDAVTDEIHQKITERGFGVPDAQRILTFLPNTAAAEAEAESTEPPPHPLRSLVGLIDLDLREQAAALSAEASSLEMQGKWDEADAKTAQRTELRRKASRLDRVANEVVQIAERSGHDGLTHDVLERAAIMYHGEEAAAQGLITVAEVPVAALPPGPTGDEAIDLGTSIRAASSAPGAEEGDEMTDEEFRAGVESLLGKGRAADFLGPELKPPAPAIPTRPADTTTAAGSTARPEEPTARPEADQGPIQFFLEGNQLVLGDKRYDLELDDIVFLERMRPTTEQWITGKDLQAGLGYDQSHYRLDKRLRRLRAIFEAATGKKGNEVLVGLQGFGYGYDGVNVTRKPEDPVNTGGETAEVTAAPAVTVPAAAEAPKLDAAEIGGSTEPVTGTPAALEIKERAETDISQTDETLIRSLVEFDSERGGWSTGTVRQAVEIAYAEELLRLEGRAREERVLTLATQIQIVRARELGLLIEQGRDLSRLGRTSGYEHLVELVNYIDGLTFKDQRLYRVQSAEGFAGIFSRSENWEHLKDRVFGVRRAPGRPAGPERRRYRGTASH